MATRKKIRRDLDQEVTDLIISRLEAGAVPWRKPWTSAGIMPTSASTGRAYRGINVWLLSIAAETGGYSSPYWLTFRQAKEFGGSVRKGQKATMVVFFRRLTVEDKEATEPDATKTLWLMRHYSVFNLEQTDGVTLPPRFELTEREPVEVLDAVEQILAGYANGPSITHRTQDGAFYSPADDAITLPALEQFDTPIDYAETALHEVTHSTGHASRLNRFERNGEPQHFGSARYAREELVAEMGAAILAAAGGIDLDLDNSAAYVANWLEALKADSSLITKAAQQAQRAVDRITGTTFEEEVAA